ncbi:hypothetical protein MA16_Dca007157 [Dendrobium catenatum]|uniref:Uncharacterized protein n=1 Tax=Dendrobium catenatum TaxID=906689 RepID=A0A2I0W411_9ASPA|nr:hypothetical protein MA16_Dca007157 [Dendrobium catenatum]
MDACERVGVAARASAGTSGKQRGKPQERRWQLTGADSFGGRASSCVGKMRECVRAAGAGGGSSVSCM